MDEANSEIILITNTVYPYHLHNVAILSLPFGSTYHFRYEHRYFNFDAEQIGELAGKTGILVLRDFERGSFIPLRTFRVLTVDDCGDFVFLDLEFQHFIQYAVARSELDPESPAGADELLHERERYSNTISVQLLVNRVRNNKNQHLEKLILLANPAELGKIARTTVIQGGQFAHAWSQVVNALGCIGVYSHVCFYLVSTVLELKSGCHASRFRARWRAGLVLETGKVYLIQVNQLIGDRSIPPRPGYKMRLQYMEGCLAPLRSEIAVDGAYDRLSFVVAVQPQEREVSQSEMSLTCDQAVPDPADPERSSPIPGASVHLQIQWPAWDRFMKWAGNPVLFFAGAALFVMADQIGRWINVGENGKYMVQLIGLALLALGGRTWSFLTSGFKSGPPGSRTAP